VSANKIITIVTYSPLHHQRFKEINEQWISARFVLEEEDIKTLLDPEKYILKSGGEIFIALCDGNPVGTCAYLNFGNNNFEMIKMAVDLNYRGQGIGKKIGEESLRKMKKHGAKKIFLFSNTKGSVEAIQLYRKLGFVEVELGESEFIRADIKMELVF
jgi:ribosomal protein S18 acetylase RimI-like enzyme